MVARGSLRHGVGDSEAPGLVKRPMLAKLDEKSGAGLIYYYTSGCVEELSCYLDGKRETTEVLLSSQMSHEIA